MDLLDGTIVNVAAPSSAPTSARACSALQWIAGGYALAFAIGLVTGGRLGDIFGRRRLFLIGVAGFTTASALCGARADRRDADRASAWSRALFAALMIPQGFGILAPGLPADEIQKAFGLFGPVIGLSAVLGPVIGGALTDGDCSASAGARSSSSTSRWACSRSIGARQAAAGVAAPTTGRRSTSRGAALVTLAAGLLIYPLIQGREAGWPAWTFVSIGRQPASRSPRFVAARAQPRAPRRLARW